MKKKSFLLILSLIIGSSSFAQLKSPNASPRTNISQIIGLVKVNLDYSRPSKKGRKIFGGLVPFNKIWRTGADNSTKISFSTDVVIAGQIVNSGTYSVFSIPNQKEWDVILYSDTEIWGVPRDWSEEKIVFSSKFSVNQIDKAVETFTVSFNKLTNNDVSLNISWENTSVDIKIEVPTKSMVEKDIQKVLNNNPKASDFYAAAVFYRQENIMLDKALEWMNKAIEMTESPKFWQYRQQSLIMAANNKYKNAVEAAKKSLELATKADNQDYVKMNKESISEWSKKF